MPLTLLMGYQNNLDLSILRGAFFFLKNGDGCIIMVEHTRNQREECGCVESVEIGAYNTCLNGCKYCYGKYSEERVEANKALYDVHSPILCSKITERAVKSIKEGQISLFDLI